MYMTDGLMEQCIYNGAFYLDVSPSIFISESVCTECTSHDSLHPAMLHGMTEMLYTVSGSSGVTSNDVVSFSVELYATIAIDPL